MKDVQLLCRVDAEVDAASIQIASKIRDGASVAQVVVEDDRIRGGGVVLDLDAEGHLLGIELLGWSDLTGR